MSETQELSYDEPWPMYADEEEPWKDFDRLLKLREQMDTQQEMGAALGCTPGTISYWLKKARKEYEPEYDDEVMECDFHDVCGYHAPTPNNGLCFVCLDLARHNNRQEHLGVEFDGFEDREEHMAALYEQYPDFVEQREEAYRMNEDDDSEDSEDES